VALATPPGEAALGIVRVSGPAALSVVQPLLSRGRALRAFPPRELRRVSLIDPLTGEGLDEALCVVMRAPASYTGEDVVELSCHGSPAVLRMVIERIIGAGARLATPGEFTRRAFLAGRLDLAQAEAVALLIGARTERAVALAARAVAGGLAQRLRRIHEVLLDVVAGLEVSLDFPEEHVGLDVAPAVKTLSQLREEVSQLRDVARRGRIVHEGITIAIVGPPNAGKSSLLNALLGRERAIVSPQPGTTRDVLEGVIALAGVPVRLLDTAGLGQARDPIDAEGMRRTRMAMDESDLLVVVQDGSVPVDAAVLAETGVRPHLLVRAKSDLPAHSSHAALDAIAISSCDGTGLDDLVAALSAAARDRAGMDDDESGIVASLRQVELLDTLFAALNRFAGALATAPIEAALVDAHEAIQTVGAILGIDVADAVLDRIFSTFCLGK
jgi:tRNA modification GTPase